MKKGLVLAIVAGVMWTSSPDVCAGNYYVDTTGGNDNNDGQSDATAWRTISKVNNYSFQTGDDVYFKCGGTWTGTRLNIDWSGISGNSVVIGAYYMSGGNEVHGSNGNKPVFDGNNAVPGEYLGLINVYRQDCVTIENIKIVNSLSDGVRFSGSKTIDATNNNATNIDTAHIYNVGIKYHHIDTGVVEGCDVTDSCRIELSGGGWPAALSVTYSSNITIRKNSVRENYGEGIGIYKISDNCIVENNLCYANEKVQIYIDSSAGTVVRGNLCYGTIDSAYWRGNFPGLGIGIADEGWVPSHSENNKIYNNLVAYSSLGIFLWRARDDSSWPLKDTFVYNNVVIDCLTNLTVSNRNVFENSAIKNNIFWSISGDSVQAAVASSHSGLVLDYNLWSSVPDADARGVNDPSYTAPQLLKTSGWRSMTGGDIQGSDFALQPTSPAIDAGTNLGSPYNQGLNPVSTWPNNVSILDQNNYGTDWEIGAYVFTGIACLPIDQTGWSLEYFDSEETVGEDGAVTNSFDGNPDTIWHTEWFLTDPDPAHPHEIQIDLGGFYDICGFRYLPRQEEEEGGENGMIKDYEFYVSDDSDDWGSAIASGTFVKDKTEKQVSFDRKLGRYVRLVALSEVNDNSWTSMAELNVLAVQPDTDINDDGKVDLEDFAALATWWDDENACSLPDWCDGADFNMSGTVDMLDLAYFVENWL